MRKTAQIAVTSIFHTLPQTAQFRLLFDFGYFSDFLFKSLHKANVARIFKSYGTEQNLTVFTNLYLRKKSHSVKKSKQSEKRGWKFYPPSELVRMPLKIFSTFFKISFLLKLNLSKNRDCCKFYSFATAP